MNRVVITGIGIYSCIGVGKEQVLESLRTGKCGLVVDPERIGFRSLLTGKIPSPKIPYALKRFMSQETEYVYEAAKEALSEAGNLGECGVIIGNDGSSKAMALAIDSFSRLGKTSKLGPTHVLTTLTSNPSAVLTHLLPLKGVSFSVGGACASGAHAIGVAYNLIRCGVQDAILCGGCQEVNKDAVFAFDALGNFSTAEDPSKAVRPFDTARSGLVPSGGGACLVLENINNAIARGAKIYGEMVGYGATSSGSLAASDCASQVLCMKKALGSIPTEKVGVVSAHATGTPSGDLAEANAIKEVFANSPYVSATKALTGHEMWMAGASELIYMILSIRNGFIPPNSNTENGSMGLNIHRETVPIESCEYFLSNSFGLGGTNSSLLISMSV